ncbi:hypothetical protein GJ496_002376 [Pomphorhynchus laevis]|nr:hypothetical protein GJ496_002376 [Pomphorhynchus laevis]
MYLKTLLANFDSKLLLTIYSCLAITVGLLAVLVILRNILYDLISNRLSSISHSVDNIIDSRKTRTTVDWLLILLTVFMLIIASLFQVEQTRESVEIVQCIFSIFAWFVFFLTKVIFLNKFTRIIVPTAYGRRYAIYFICLVCVSELIPIFAWISKEFINPKSGIISPTHHQNLFTTEMHETVVNSFISQFTTTPSNFTNLIYVKNTSNQTNYTEYIWSKRCFYLIYTMIIPIVLCWLTLLNCLFCFTEVISIKCCCYKWVIIRWASILTLTCFSVINFLFYSYFSIAHCSKAINICRDSQRKHTRYNMWVFMIQCVAAILIHSILLIEHERVNERNYFNRVQVSDVFHDEQLFMQEYVKSLLESETMLSLSSRKSLSRQSSQYTRILSKQQASKSTQKSDRCGQHTTNTIGLKFLKLRPTN